MEGNDFDTALPAPKVYRAMKRDPADSLPVLESSAKGLGIRPGIDVQIDPLGRVSPGGQGMSVAPNWRDLPPHRIPERLRAMAPEAIGPAETACYSLGAGPFLRGPVAAGLELIPDPGSAPKHGVIAPAACVPLSTYVSDLCNTRTAWQIDET